MTTPILSDEIVSYIDTYILPSLKGESRHPFFSFAIPLDTEEETLDAVKLHYKETVPLMALDVEEEGKHILVTAFMRTDNAQD